MARRKWCSSRRSCLRIAGGITEIDVVVCELKEEEFVGQYDQIPRLVGHHVAFIKSPIPM